MQGKIEKKIVDRGFGFIKYGVKEVFFHASDCKTPFDDLNEGDDVEFELESSPKGPRAIRVELV